MPERTTPYGLIWDEFVGMDGQRRILRKDQGVRTQRQFMALLLDVYNRKKLVALIGSWHPKGEYTPEETRQLIVSDLPAEET